MPSSEWGTVHAVRQLAETQSSHRTLADLALSCQPPRKLFVNIWIPVFGMLSQVVHWILPGKRPLEYHLCSGSDPDEVQLESRRNLPLLVTYLFTLAVNILVPARIRHYQLTQKTFKKEFNLNLTDLTTNLAILIFVGLSSSSILIQYQIIPANLNKYPYYIQTYMLQILIPKLVTLIVMITYYYRNASLRVTVWRSLKESLDFDAFRIGLFS